ncbi:hypothetical protein ACVGXN_10015, partial [Enterobacter hormaechei]
FFFKNHYSNDFFLFFLLGFFFFKFKFFLEFGPPRGIVLIGFWLSRTEGASPPLPSVNQPPRVVH